MDVTSDQEARTAYDRGLRFYANRLFLANGTPKFFANRTYPIDAQCAAQGIASLALAGLGEPHWLEQAWRVYRFVVARMRMADGSFVFQRGRLGVNRTPHVRWVQAPLFEAFSRLLVAAQPEPRASP